MSITEDSGKHRDYVSYLLRMWQDSSDEELSRSREAAWRATLQSPRTGERVGFSSLDDLFDFLKGQAGLEPTADGVQNEV
jgi:hypothetical protein